MPKNKECYFRCARVGPLHKFPSCNHPHTERYKQWKATLLPETQERGDTYIFNSIRYCSRHFEDFYVYKPSGLLGRNAVPTLNLEFCEEPTDNKERVKFIDGKNTSSSDEVAEVFTCKQETDNDLRPLGDTFDDEKPPVKQEFTFSWQQSTNEVLDIDADTLSVSKTPIHCINTREPDRAVAVDTTREKRTATLDTTRVKSIESVKQEPSASLSPQEISWRTDTDENDGYVCYECGRKILGLHYACLQCADCDLCGACELTFAHRTHYVLRVPAYRPVSEVQAKLSAIRRLLMDAVIHVTIKEEKPDNVEDPIELENPKPHLDVDLDNLDPLVPEIQELDPIATEVKPALHPNMPKSYTKKPVAMIPKLLLKSSELDPNVPKVVTRVPNLHSKRYVFDPKEPKAIPKVTELHTKETILDSNSAKLVQIVPELHPKAPEFLTEYKKRKLKESDHKQRITSVTELHPKESILDPNAAKLVQRVPELHPKVPEFSTEYKKRKLMESDRKEHRVKIELTAKSQSDGPLLDTHKPWRVSLAYTVPTPPAPSLADCKQATVLVERLSKAELEAALRPKRRRVKIMP